MCNYRKKKKKKKKKIIRKYIFWPHDHHGCHVGLETKKLLKFPGFAHLPKVK